MSRRFVYFGILLFAFNLNADTYFGLGTNVSAFETSKAKAMPGFYFTLGKQWHIYKGLGLDSELRYSRRGSALKNITSVDYDNFDPEYDDIQYSDWTIVKNSFDLPLLLSVDLHLKDWKYRFTFGASISIDYQINAHRTITKKIPFADLSQDEQHSFKFDYESKYIEEIIGSGHSSCETGLRINKGKYFFHIFIVRSYIERVFTTYLKEHLDTVNVGLGVIF